MRNFLSLLMLISLASALLIVGCKDSATDPELEGIEILVISNNAETIAWIDTNFTNNMEKVRISVIDVSLDTLRAEDLEGFDVILLYEDGTFSNSIPVGNRLYQYVMSGGDLVIGTFYWQDRSGEGWNGSWGDLEMIEPLYGGTCRYNLDSLGSTVSHPLTEGVNSLKSFYRGGPNTLRSNATAVAWWTNQDILIAFNKPMGTITMVTTYPAEDYYWETRGNPEAVEGDFFRLWENALRWTALNTIAPETALPKSAFKQISPPVEDKNLGKSGARKDF